MSLIFNLIIIPIIFGLIGFFEPCSFGVNSLFLSHISKFEKSKRIKETIIFSLIRGFILSLFGLLAVFIGTKFVKVESNLFFILGIIYFILGIYLIFKKYLSFLTFQINFSKLIKNKETYSLGIIFGFIIPACAIPFIITLMTEVSIIQNFLMGFISLFLFGISLSIPIIFLTLHSKSNELIKKISNKTKNIDFILGLILIIFGILTILSKNWWLAGLN